jgi:hypothetical protein
MAGYIGNRAVALSTTAANVTGTITAGALDISGDTDVDGTTNLDVVDIDGAVDMASTLAVGGVVTANAGVVVDNITIDSNELDISTNFTIDASGYIIIDSDDGNIYLNDNTVGFGQISGASQNLTFKSSASDKDMIFQGNDGGSAITALTLDMSEAGAATFNAGATFGGNIITNAGEVQVSPASGTAKLRLTSQGSGSEVFSLCGQIPGTSNTGFSIRNETDSRNDLVIDGSGNVGIGTTSPVSNTPLTLEPASGYTDALQLRSVGTNIDSRINIAPTGSGNAQINNSAGTAIDFQISGVDKMILDSSGNVGIGVSPETTSNGKSLTINRTVINDDDAGSFHISQNAYYNSAWKYVENGTGEKITFASGVITFDRAASNSGGADASLTWSESMRIDSSGNVGIGTTTVHADLHLGAASPHIDIGPSTGNRGKVGFDSNNVYIGSTSGTGEIHFKNNIGSTDAPHSSGDTKMVITDSGVGIGESSPNQSLVVKNASDGAVIVANTAQAGGQGIGFFTDTTNNRVGVFNNSSSTLDMVFNTGGTATSGEAMRIDNSNGAVGINDTDPSSYPANTQTGSATDAGQFRIGGSVGAICASGTGNELAYTRSGLNYISSPNGGFRIRAGSSGGVNLSDAATSWTSASDERLKTLTGDIENAIDKVKTLRTKMGHYNDDSQKVLHPFLIAQDVKAVLPEAVSVIENDPNVEDKTGVTDKLYLSYTDVIPLLTAALKECITKNEALEARITALEAG